ncbi:hypothetical protein KSP35_05465 [Aquihabitans sp. G128]|uniref:hypothetical protein n=1 Tax=Aquihabitans sp. G128 TaxID=2849779 RepID=UPI001C231A76|nr:hypothetical protein [Aquihabitans sp. G128]QXC62256.1 hypothetical protein KSP35_05465 [Aquihabitans sp. G128]
MRTYDSAWLYPVARDQPLAEALADTATRCKAPAGTEAQGEAISFAADSASYVTIGEGSKPVLTTVSAG